jgi:uncharacterized protein (DUF885 family)
MNRPLSLTLALILSASTLPAAPVTADAPTSTTSSYLSRSNAYALEVLKGEARFSPEQAAQEGLDGYDEQVTVFSPERRSQMIAAGRATEKHLQDLLAHESDPQVKQDLSIALDSVRRQIRGEELQERYELPYINVSGVIFRGIQSLLDDQVKPERRAAALVRLRRYAGLEPGTKPMTVEAEEVLTAKLANPALEGPSKLQLQKDLDTSALRIKGVDQLFTKYKIAGYEEPLATLKKQLADYDQFLREKVMPRARADFREQPEIYQYSLEQYGVDIPASQLVDLAHEAFNNVQAQMQLVAKQVAKERGFKDPDYRAVIRELKKDQIPNDEVLAHYKGRLTEIEKIIRDKDLVTLPDRPAQIRLGTEAESASQPAPHMVPPRLIGNTGEVGVFVLPLSIPAPIGSKAAALKMDDFTHKSASWTLTAHEARPGHELQFDGMVEHGVSIARANFAFNSVNAEGWGLYSEWMMYPYEPSDGQLMALWARLQRAARAFIDPELQMGKMTPEQALNFLQTEVVMSPGMAAQEVERYTFRSPGQATSYFYGYLRLRELRADVERTMGKNFNQHRYHDFLLAQGLLPPDLLRKAVFEQFVHQPDPGRRPDGLKQVLN